MRMLRSDPVFVQQEGAGDELSFGFRGRICSLITFVIAVLLIVGANVIGEGVRHRSLLIPGCYVFSALFVWSSIYSYFTIKTLRIHAAEKVVKYSKSNFMGTDEWERWPKNPQFTDYVGGRFRDGAGWNYQSVQREVSVSDSADFAWFDEVVFSAANGRFRGTGVLVKQGDDWKIAHYAMSFLIFNENWQDVVELTRKMKELKDKAGAAGT